MQETVFIKSSEIFYFRKNASLLRRIVNPKYAEYAVMPSFFVLTLSSCSCMCHETFLPTLPTGTHPRFSLFSFIPKTKEATAKILLYGWIHHFYRLVTQEGTRSLDSCPVLHDASPYLLAFVFHCLLN